MGFKGSRVRISPSRPLIPNDLAPHPGRFFVRRVRSPCLCRASWRRSGPPTATKGIRLLLDPFSLGPLRRKEPRDRRRDPVAFGQRRSRYLDGHRSLLAISLPGGEAAAERWKRVGAIMCFVQRTRVCARDRGYVRGLPKRDRTRRRWMPLTRKQAAPTRKTHANPGGGHATPEVTKTATPIAMLAIAR